MSKTVRIACGAAWSRDRLDHVDNVVYNGNIQYICFDAMSEITMSATVAGNVGKANPVMYDPYLEIRFRDMLKKCMDRKIKIITNAGWADAKGAAKRVMDIAESMGIEHIKVAAVYNSEDILPQLPELGLVFQETGEPVAKYADVAVCVDVYLGADGIVKALQNGADVVITSRVVDSAVYLGALAYEFGWSLDDVQNCAKASIIGHLMECGVHITGGYFADPGYKEVPDISRLGGPIVEVTEDHVYITKTKESGGVVSTATCKEQMLYEVTKANEYILPNVVVDFSEVKFRQVEKDVVEVSGFKGRPAPEKLKAIIGMREGYTTEEMVVFAGPAAMPRAEITKQILLDRFEMIGFKPRELRMNYVGINAILREATPADATPADPFEVVLRIAAKDDDVQMLGLLRKEVDAMACNGPASTGKYGSMAGGVRPVIGMYSTLIDRSLAQERVAYFSF